MLETLKLGATAFLLLAAAMVVDVWIAYGAIVLPQFLLAVMVAALAVGVIWLAGHWCRHDRERLANVFGISVRVLLLLVAAFVFVQGCVLILAFVRGYEAGIRNGRLAVGLLVCTLVVFSSSAAIAGSIRTMSQKLVARAIGSVVTAETQPRLWEFVSSIAAKLGAVPPKQIILGLDPTFYATATDIELIGTDQWVGGDTMASNVKLTRTSQRVTGETVFLSMPLMRILSKNELAAVIGHELGHFKGLDTAYTLKFVPVYRGVVHAMEEISSASSGSLSGRWVTSPASTILSFYLSEFAKAEREISRERELEADRCGAQVASPHAVVAALVKVATFTPIWPQLCDHAVEIAKEGKMFSNMSLAFAEHAGVVRNDAEIAKYAEAILASRQTHPTDTHPPIETRARALGVPTSDFEVFLNLDAESASSLVPEVEKLEEILSGQAQQLFAAH